MNSLRKRNLLRVIFLTVLLIYAYIAGRLSRTATNIFVSGAFSLSRHLVHLGMVTIWFVSLKQRILSETVRRYLLLIAGLIIFWLYIRTIKWMFFFDGIVNRYFWYAYYIPMILIPLFGVFIVQCIGKPQDYRLPRKMKFLYVSALTLLGLIFTNDMHQLAFGFPKGIQYYSGNYTYHIVYFLVLTWCVCLGLYFIVMLLVKSQAPGKKWGRKVPFLILTAGVVMTAIYCLRIIIFDMTAVNCLLIILLLESCIQSGFIRSNSMYDALFSAATIEASITDRNGQVYYAAEQSVQLTAELKDAVAEGTVTIGNKCLNRAEISNGYVFWWDDISSIRHYTEELEKTGRRLEENNDLLKAELALREKQFAVAEKNRLYDRLALDCASQLERLRKLAVSEDSCRLSEPELAERLSTICVLCAYIKRRSNLFLMSEHSLEISSKELEYALIESLDNIRLTGTMCASDFKCGGQCEAALLIALFDAYEEIVSQLLFDMEALFVKMTIDSAGISLRLQIDSEKELSTEKQQKWEQLGGSRKVNREGDTLWIFFSMPKTVEKILKGETDAAI